MGELKAIAELAKITGIAGLAMGVLLVAFRDVVRAKVLSRLSARHSFELLRLALLLSFAMAILGLAAWVYAHRQVDRAARCAPAITSHEQGALLDVRTACQPDEQAARRQAVVSAEAVREPIAQLLAVQLSYLPRATEAYSAQPTPENWKRVMNYVTQVDHDLNTSIKALSRYEASSGQNAGSDALRRVLAKRIEYLAQFSSDHPLSAEKARLLGFQYYDLSKDTYCALSSFIRDNGGEPPRDPPPGVGPNGCA